MEIIFNNASFQTSLRWLYGSKITKNDFSDFTEKHSSKGLFFQSNEFMAYGVLDSEDKDEETNLPSLAAAFADYKKNCVVFLKLAAEEGDVYWGGLISNGVPIIDFAANDLDSVISPILKRLTEPGGASYLYVEAPTLLFGESIEEELKANNKFNQLLFARGGLVELKLNPSAIQVDDAFRVKKIKFNSGKTIPNQKNILKYFLLGVVILLSLFFAFGGENESVVSAKFTPSFKLPVEAKDYSNEMNDLFSEYVDGNKYSWVVNAYKLMGQLNDNLGPFRKTSGECVAREKVCTLIFTRVGVRDYKHVAEMLTDKGVVFFISLDAKKLTIKLPFDFETKEELTLNNVDKFTPLRKFLYVRNDVKQRTSDMELGISEPSIISIGGKKGFFSSLSLDLKEKLSFFSYPVLITGKSRHHLTVLEKDVSMINNLLIASIERKFLEEFGKSWSLKGEYLINIKEGVSNNEIK